MTFLKGLHNNYPKFDPIVFPAGQCAVTIHVEQAFFIVQILIFGTNILYNIACVILMKTICRYSIYSGIKLGLFLELFVNGRDQTADCRQTDNNQCHHYTPLCYCGHL